MFNSLILLFYYFSCVLFLPLCIMESLTIYNLSLILPFSIVTMSLFVKNDPNIQIL